MKKLREIFGGIFAKKTEVSSTTETSPITEPSPTTEPPSANKASRTTEVSPTTEAPPTIEPFTIISGRTVAEICGDFELQKEAKPHLSGEPAPHEFVDRLLWAKLHTDAVRFITYGLPKREAVWWACLCVRSVPVCYGEEISTKAIQAAEAWVKSSVETNRKAALSAGSKHNFEMPGAPAAWTAMAAGWSGEAVKTDDENVPAPPEHLTAHAASGAIILAAGADPDRADEVSRQFLEMGVQIAQGKIQISA